MIFIDLGEEPTYNINGSFSASGKDFSINFSKAKIKFCLSLHYNGNNSYLFVNAKEIYKFKASNKKICLERIYNKLGATDSKEISLKGNVNDFSDDYKSMDQSNILNIHKYLMIKNNV